MAEPNTEPSQFRLIRSSTIRKECYKLVEGGFIYNKQRVIGDVTHWQCEKTRVCKARLHTKMNEIVKRTGEHLHSPDILAVNCLEVKDRMKRKARQTHDTTHHIIGDELEIITGTTAAKLPKLDSMKRTIRRERQVRNIAPVQPESLHDLAIPPEFTITAKEENFLLYDSGPELTRILIFGTQKNCDMLTTSNIWLADGTFKTAPQLFAQVYTIHALRGGPNPLQDGHLLPCLFILLPNKTEATYTRMWERIRIICPTASPTSMIMDFEKAAINAFQMEWPTTTVKGCFFHFAQNVWRKIQELGLQTDYINDEQLALRLRMLPALAFAPPLEVQELFPQVIEQLDIPASLELALYFENTYIGRTVPGGTQLAPLFPIEMWNHHHDVPQGIPRTTNAVEAWHRAYNVTIGCHHPNIWKWIIAIRREQGLVEVKQAKFLAGDKPSKRTKNSANEEGLTNLVLSYFHRSQMEFLQGIAHRLTFGTN